MHTLGFFIFFLLGWLVLPAQSQQVKWETLPEVKLRTGFNMESVVAASDGTIFLNAEGRGTVNQVVADLFALKGSAWSSRPSIPFTYQGEAPIGGTVAYGMNVPYGKVLVRSWPLTFSDFRGTRNLTELQVVTETDANACIDKQPVVVTGKDYLVNSLRGIFPGIAGKWYVNGLRVTNNNPSSSGLYLLRELANRQCVLEEVALLPEGRHILLQAVEIAENRFIAERLDYRTLERDVAILTLDPRSKTFSVMVLVTQNQNLSTATPPPYVGKRCCKLVADYEGHSVVIGYKLDNQDPSDTYLFVGPDFTNKDGSVNTSAIKKVSIGKAFEPIGANIRPVTVRGNIAVFIGSAANTQGTPDTTAVYHAAINTVVRIARTGTIADNRAFQPTDFSHKNWSATTNKVVGMFGGKISTATINWPPPSARISAAPTTVSKGETATITWQAENASAATLNGTSVNLSGELNIKLDSTTTFVLKASGLENKVVEQSVTVTVTAPAPPPPPPPPPPPVPQIAGANSGIMDEKGNLVPIFAGGTVVLYGANLSVGTCLAELQTCSTSVVTPDGTPLPVTYASPNQVNLLLPGFGAGDVWIQVRSGGLESDWFRINIMSKPTMEEPVPPEAEPEKE